MVHFPLSPIPLEVSSGTVVHVKGFLLRLCFISSRCSEQVCASLGFLVGTLVTAVN